MAFHPVAFTIEVRITGDHQGDKRISTIHYRWGVGNPSPTVQLLTDVANDVATRILPRMAAMVHNTTRWTEVKATNINAAGGNTFTLPLSPPIVGLGGGDVLPGNSNFAMKKNTNLNLRHAWGNLFMMDLPETSQNDATVTTAYLALAANLAASLMQRTPAASLYAPVVASKFRLVPYPMVSVSFDSNLDSLYVRLRGKRRHKRHH